MKSLLRTPHPEPRTAPVPKCLRNSERRSIESSLNISPKYVPIVSSLTSFFWKRSILTSPFVLSSRGHWLEGWTDSPDTDGQKNAAVRRVARFPSFQIPNPGFHACFSRRGEIHILWVSRRGYSLIALYTFSWLDKDIQKKRFQWKRYLFRSVQSMYRWTDRSTSPWLIRFETIFGDNITFCGSTRMVRRLNQKETIYGM